MACVPAGNYGDSPASDGPAGSVFSYRQTSTWRDTVSRGNLSRERRESSHGYFHCMSSLNEFPRHAGYWISKCAVTRVTAERMVARTNFHDDLDDSSIMYY